MRRLGFFEPVFDLVLFSPLELLRQWLLRLVVLDLVSGMLGIEL